MWYVQSIAYGIYVHTEHRIRRSEYGLDPVLNLFTNWNDFILLFTLRFRWKFRDLIKSMGLLCIYIYILENMYIIIEKWSAWYTIEFVKISLWYKAISQFNSMEWAMRRWNDFGFCRRAGAHIFGSTKYRSMLRPNMDNRKYELHIYRLDAKETMRLGLRSQLYDTVVTYSLFASSQPIYALYKTSEFVTFFTCMKWVVLKHVLNVVFYLCVRQYNIVFVDFMNSVFKGYLHVTAPLFFGENGACGL